MSNAFEISQDGGSASSDAYLVGRSHNNPTFSNLAYTGTLTGGTGIINIGSGQIYKDASGKVGIGTSSPISALDVATGENTYQRVRTTSGTAAAVTLYQNADTGTTDSDGLYVGIDDSETAFVWNFENKPLAFGTNNTERLRITADGNVGIGTSTVDADALWAPGTRMLRISGTGDTYGTLRVDSNGTNGLTISSGYSSGGPAYVWAESALIIAAGNTERLRITADGNVCIGATAPTYSNQKVFTYAASGNLYNTIRCDSLANGQTLGHEATYLDYSRYIGIYVLKHAGITNPCGALVTQTESGTVNNIWVDNSNILRISTAFSNVGTTSGTVVGAQTSDERLKNITGPVPYGLDEVLALEPIAYAMKSEPDVLKIGFSAQQVLPIIPESVFDTHEELEPGEPTKLGMEYVSLIPVLVNAIKELNEELLSLKARIH